MSNQEQNLLQVLAIVTRGILEQIERTGGSLSLVGGRTVASAIRRLDQAMASAARPVLNGQGQPFCWPETEPTERLASQEVALQAEAESTGESKGRPAGTVTAEAETSTGAAPARPSVASDSVEGVEAVLTTAIRHAWAGHQPSYVTAYATDGEPLPVAVHLLGHGEAAGSLQGSSIMFTDRELAHEVLSRAATVLDRHPRPPSPAGHQALPGLLMVSGRLVAEVTREDLAEGQKAGLARALGLVDRLYEELAHRPADQSEEPPLAIVHLETVRNLLQEVREVVCWLTAITVADYPEGPALTLRETWEALAREAELGTDFPPWPAPRLAPTYTKRQELVDRLLLAVHRHYSWEEDQALQPVDTGESLRRAAEALAEELGWEPPPREGQVNAD